LILPFSFAAKSWQNKRIELKFEKKKGTKKGQIKFDLQNRTDYRRKRERDYQPRINQL